MSISNKKYKILYYISILCIYSVAPKYNNDVIGSSNLSDIKDYCKANNITYLTTIDFLYYAIRKKLITVEEAILFVEEVKRKDSKLPEVDFNTFVSTVQI